jgi:hypothetical protein
LLGTSVSEIHRYPLRPEGFAEHLFPTRESRLAVGKHLLEAPWLSRASEAVPAPGAFAGAGGAGGRRDEKHVRCVGIE